LGDRLSQKVLAQKAGVARMTLVAIEEGSTRTPDHETLDKIAQALEVDTDSLRRALDRWHAMQPQFTYDPAVMGAKAALAKDFFTWRTTIEPSATRFAEQLGVARATLTGYEAGHRRYGMPDTLQAGLLKIGCPISLVEELAKLPANSRVR
jgi:transcriptional regulator with XRE-family HTH domain